MVNSNFRVGIPQKCLTQNSNFKRFEEITHFQIAGLFGDSLNLNDLEFTNCPENGETKCTTMRKHTEHPHDHSEWFVWIRFTKKRFFAKIKHDPPTIRLLSGDSLVETVSAGRSAFWFLENSKIYRNF